jgi:hypothetical protein
MLQDHSVAQETGLNKRWLGLLDEYGVQFLALDLHSDSGLVELIRSQPGWTVDFEDGEGVLFARTGIACRNPPEFVEE